MEAVKIRYRLDRKGCGYNYDSTSIRRPFDCCQRSSRSQWRNTYRWSTSHSHADLFIYL